MLKICYIRFFSNWRWIQYNTQEWWYLWVKVRFLYLKKNIGGNWRMKIRLISDRHCTYIERYNVRRKMTSAALQTTSIIGNQYLGKKRVWAAKLWPFRKLRNAKYVSHESGDAASSLLERWYLLSIASSYIYVYV